MVKINIVSSYITDLPTESIAGRVKIAGGRPLYDLAQVKAIMKGKSNVMGWTDKCRNDVRKWFEDDWQRVMYLLKSLKLNDYIDSEWCENGQGAWAACDAYRARSMELAPATGKPMTMEYFLKFAVSKTGKVILMVSCHA